MLTEDSELSLFFGLGGGAGVGVRGLLSPGMAIESLQGGIHSVPRSTDTASAPYALAIRASQPPYARQASAARSENAAVMKAHR